MIQLQLFPEELDYKKEFEDMQFKYNKLAKEWDKTRKSLFAKQGELVKKINEISHDFEYIKLNICKGKIQI